MKSEIVTDSKNYFVKATLPPGNPWRTSWLTKSEALDKAVWFVKSWLANGLANPEATIFYRDGTPQLTISPSNVLPTGNQSHETT